MELLYQDSQIVLCVKPAGLSSEAGAGSLPELLEDQLGRPVFPVHRLDRNVGGVMVYARTRQAASALSRAVQAGNLQKEYLALIHGCPTQPAGTWEDLLWKDSAKNKVFVVRQMRKGVKAAKLAYRVLEEATPLTACTPAGATRSGCSLQAGASLWPETTSTAAGMTSDPPPSGPSASPCPIPPPVKPSPACIHRRGSCGTCFP